MCANVDDVLCPIILFIDGTTIDNNSRLSLEPVLCTFGFFTQKTRESSSAWRLLGHIPQIDGYEDAKKKGMKESVMKRIDYHDMLAYLLDDIIELENSKGIRYCIQVMDEETNSLVTTPVTLKFTIMFVMGDAVGLDKLCDRYSSYGKNVKFLCRDCNCPTDDLDNMLHRCQFTKRSDIKSFSSPQEFKDNSYYDIPNNIFDKMRLGDDPYGINGLCPPEVLHQYLLGLLKTIIGCFFSRCTKPTLHFLNKVSKYISIN